MEHVLGRIALVPGLAWRQVWRSPATACCLTVVWVVGLATGSIAHGPPGWLSGRVGFGPPSLGHGYWWTPLSAGLWASGEMPADRLLLTGQDADPVAPGTEEDLVHAGARGDRDDDQRRIQ